MAAWAAGFQQPDRERHPEWQNRLRVKHEQHGCDMQGVRTDHVVQPQPDEALGKLMQSEQQRQAGKHQLSWTTHFFQG